MLNYDMTLLSRSVKFSFRFMIHVIFRFIQIYTELYRHEKVNGNFLGIQLLHISSRSITSIYITVIKCAFQTSSVFLLILIKN